MKAYRRAHKYLSLIGISTLMVLLGLGLAASVAFASPMIARDAQPVAPTGLDWTIETWPQAECSGWWVDFVGSSSTAEPWRVKVDGQEIANGTTQGNETASGTWPSSLDLSQHHSFRVEIYEHGSWLGRDEEDGGFGPCGAGTCVTIQRDRNGSVADAYVWEASPNSNNGSSTSLYTGVVGSGR